jgi:hypothetical protein
MSDESASNVEVEFEVEPSFVLELNEEWIAFLEAEEPPALIAGIDPSIRYLPDSGTAYA